MGKLPNELEKLPLDELINWRNEADAIIRRRIMGEKRTLQKKLQALDRYESMALRPAKPENENPDKKPARPKALPKYRDPITGATWAGRGKRPRWMREAISRGAKQEDFLIHEGEASAASTKAKLPPRT